MVLGVEIRLRDYLALDKTATLDKMAEEAMEFIGPYFLMDDTPTYMDFLNLITERSVYRFLWKDTENRNRSYLDTLVKHPALGIVWEKDKHFNYIAKLDDLPGLEGKQVRINLGEGDSEPTLSTNFSREDVEALQTLWDTGIEAGLEHAEAERGCACEKCDPEGKRRVIDPC